jgi:hypothetical protein
MTPPRKTKRTVAPGRQPLTVFHAPVAPGDLAHDAAQATVAALRTALRFDPQPGSPTFRARLLSVAHDVKYVDRLREDPVPLVPRQTSDRDMQLCAAVQAGVDHALVTGGVALVAGPARFGAGPAVPCDGDLGIEAFNAPAFAVGYARHQIGTIGKHPAPTLMLLEGAGPTMIARADECLARKLIRCEHWSLARLASPVDEADLDAPDDELPPAPRPPRMPMTGILRDLMGTLHRRARPQYEAPHLVVYEATSEGLGTDGTYALPASDFQVLLRDRLVISTCQRMGWPLVILAGSGSWPRQRALYEAAQAAAPGWPANVLTTSA